MASIKVNDFVEALMARQGDDLEEATHQVEKFFDVDFVTGDNLAILGKLSGADEQGFSDETFRLIVKGKRGRNSSNGSISDIINAFSALIGKSDQFTFEVIETFPRVVSIEIKNEDFTDDTELQDLIYEIMEDVCAGGVKFGWIKVNDDTSPFTLDDDNLGLDNGLLSNNIS